MSLHLTKYCSFGLSDGSTLSIFSSHNPPYTVGFCSTIPILQCSVSNVYTYLWIFVDPAKNESLRYDPAQYSIAQDQNKKFWQKIGTMSHSAHWNFVFDKFETSFEIF
jgi:hypothetical protein